MGQLPFARCQEQPLQGTIPIPGPMAELNLRRKIQKNVAIASRGSMLNAIRALQETNLIEVTRQDTYSISLYGDATWSYEYRTQPRHFSEGIGLRKES